MNIETNPVHRLGRFLQIMEQRLWLCAKSFTCFRATASPAAFLETNAAEMAVKQMKGAVQNREKLRERIMSATDIDPSEFNIPAGASLGEFGGKGLIFSRYPTLLQDWCRAGRKAYSLSADLQKFLEIAALSRMRWKDVTFPFPSFAIRLAVPIMIKESGGEQAIDTVLVSKRGTTLSVLAIGDDVERTKLFSAPFMAAVDQFEKRARWNKVRRELNGKIGKKDLYVPAAMSV